MEVKNRIKEIRLQKGLTQEELAIKCNLTLRQLQNIENNIKYNTTIKTAYKLKKALNVENIEMLFYVTNS